MNRYLIGTLALIGLAILLIVLLFTGGSKKATPPTTHSFSSYAYSDSEMKVVIDGPIVAAQNHDTVVIAVNRNTATYSQIQGYDGNVVNSKIFNNTQNGYKNFVYALYYAGYANGQSLPTYTGDTGLCPTGNRYDYYITENGQQVQHYWITNCAITAKTYLGNQPLTLTLFEAQIPNIGNLSQNANISGL